MSGPLDPALESALARFAALPRVLVALDFDGVLAPIVDDPAAARALPASDAALRALAGADGVSLALVSGRSMASLRAAADPPPQALLAASHGAEGDGAPSGDLDAGQRALLARVAEGVAAVVAAHPGTSAEDKPAGAVLHLRRAGRDVAARAERAALEGPGALEGVVLRRGKEVVELAVVHADKGSAVAALRERTGVAAVLFAGDDVTDEDAFAVLDGGDGGVDVGVKVGDGETAAQHRVADPEAVAALLQRLVALRATR